MTTDATGKKCTQCGCAALGEGFIEDTGDSSRGFSNWVNGRLERGPLGGARRMGKTRLAIAAFRCPECGHLELFAWDK